MKIRLKKILLATIIALEMFALNFSTAWAVKIFSPDEFAAAIEKRYHLNLESIQNQGENYNVSDNKKVSPQVLLSFSPTDPNIGEQITASAFPIYFNNPKGNLYYTWYLKHPECAESKKGDSDYLAKCDLNKDDKVNVNDWKIEAMRIIATNGFDWNRALGNGSPNCAAGVTNLPEYCGLENKYLTAADDKDGYKAIQGGSDKQSMPAHCYIHDFESGINYELVKKLPDDSDASCQDLGDSIIRVPACVKTQDAASGDIFSSSCVKTSSSLSCQSTTAVCPSGETPMCVDSAIINDDPLESSACDSVAEGSGNPFDSAVQCTETGTANNDVDFLCDDSNRRHLFPYPEDGHPSDTGDNEFGRSEEKFWRTNPEDPDTADNGNKDEANVVGLGRDAFSWNYEPGDKVGVAVEGASVTSTKYDDSSLMIMWALPKNKCEIEATGIYTTTIRGYQVKIPVTAIADSSDGQDDCIDGMCLNDCLSENLVDPREGGQSAKLDISLSYTPENPINDSSGANEGDELSIRAAVMGSQEHTYLKYAWEIYTADEMNPGDWGPPLLKSALPGIGQTAGIGLDTLKFKLNFADPVPKFLKAKVAVSENVAEGITNEGRSEIIIPLNSSASKIHVFSTIVSPGMTLALDQQERCDSGLDRALCPIVQNEIVGVQLDNPNNTFTNFIWSVNGDSVNPINYPGGGSCLSGECDPATGANTNIAFFPVLQEKGRRYNVSVTADNVDGKKVTVTKTFEVADPEIKIISGDINTTRPVLLGNYVDLDNRSWPDYSDTNFQAVSGSTISLMPILNNPFVKNFVWYIDGVPMTADNLSIFGATVNPDSGALAFPANKRLNEIYNVAIQALYVQDNSTKKFLNQTQNVRLDEFYESTISDSVEIQMVSSINGVSGAQASAPKKFVASLFVGLPDYLSFLFRIVLTTMLLLATSWIVLVLLPRTREE